MKRQILADMAMTVAILFLGASLVYSGGSLLRLRMGGTGAAAPLGLPELLGVGCAGAGIALLCWWLAALACAFISGVATSRGAPRLAAVTGAFSPAFMRRVVIAVLGANLLAAPMANAAQAPGIDPLWHPETVATAPATPSGDGAVHDALSSAAATPVEPRWVPHTAETDPDLLARPSTRPGAGASPSTSRTDAGGAGETDVVVKGGDSLWSIVAAALGPYSSDLDVALAWPGWYTANRETIGPDPNIILPGQVLHAPSGR
ncbi:hypothetical protein AAGW05_00535 [Arthrobacter sp. LAPM80]|uniref:LysM peptidoglycan-binding domain-containing protein n=1 Tax=Arthrobacter sp. LAPM80 TaxID=3141788 RepID=UPI00398A95CF